MGSSQAPFKLDRKTAEKNRRIHMKTLYLQLASLIPTRHSKEALSQLEQLEQATVYIQKLKQHIEEMKNKRGRAVGIHGINRRSGDQMMTDTELPLVQIRGEFYNLEVALVSGLSKKFRLSEVISVLEEEGVEVMSASFSVSGDRIVHILHLQMTSSRVGFESATAYKRLKELVQ